MNTNSLVRKNLISNVSLFALNGVIGFWLPPFMIRQMGAGTYGLIPLATSIIGYAALVTVAINGSLSRFLVLDIKRNNFEKAAKTFNTALSSLSLMLILLAPLLIYISLNISSFISVPTGMVPQARVLFLSVVVAFILTTFTSVFNTSAYLANRLDLINQVSVISTFVRVVIILLFFFLVEVSLNGYALAVVIASAGAAAYSYHLFRKYTPYIQINIRSFDKSILKDMYSMGWWLMVVQLGSILFLQIDLLVINKILGADAAGRYGALLQWSNMIRTFALSVAGIAGPMILNYYASGEKEKMLRVATLSNKLLSLLIACIVGGLGIISKDLLGLWLGEGYRDYALIFIVMLTHLPINLGVLPLFGINRAYNKVRTVGIFTCVTGFINLALAIVLTKYFHFGLMGVALASAFILTIKNFIFLPLYVAKNVGIKPTAFFKASIGSIIILLAALLLSKAYPSFNATWFMLACVFSFSLLLLMLISYFLLNKDERQQVVELILKRKKNQKKASPVPNEQDIL